jgi:hypothetical protein
MRERNILRKYFKRFAEIPFYGLWRNWFVWLRFHEIDSRVLPSNDFEAWMTKSTKTKAKRNPKHQPLLGMPIFGKYEFI